MFVAKVTGSLVATQKVDSMVGHKLLVVEPYRVDAARPQPAGHAPAARSWPSTRVGAGEGEFVLITQGSSARLTPETKNLPIDTVIIGIVDTVHVDQACVFSREEAAQGTEPVTTRFHPTARAKDNEPTCKPPKH